MLNAECLRLCKELCIFINTDSNVDKDRDDNANNTKV